MYYQQIRDITNTLQKELQTKEELASELRDAYEKLRNSAKATFDDLQM
jgi:glucose-6-phosphate-specific signal transduction histidine kinase